MSLFLKRVARYAVQKVTSDPRAREKAVETAQLIAGEIKLIAREEDRARAAGRSVRRFLNSLQDDRRSGQGDR
jgi:hypothetical protein